MNVFAWLNAGGCVTGWSTTRQDESQVEMTQAAAEESRASDPAALAAAGRKQRNARLSACDWTMLADAQLTELQKAAWIECRQDLRDVPDQVGFPQNIVWPSSP